MIQIIILIILIFFVFFYFNKKKLIEPMIFDSENMKKVYEKYNIELNNDELKKDNKIINVKNHFNSEESKKLSNNKILTSNLLNKNDIPVCKFYEWNNDLTENDNFKIINRELSYPLVIKYIYGEKGKDVYTDIISKKNLLESIQILKKQNKNEIMIEEQVEGNKYRIMVLNGKIVFACEHVSPKIVGNGKSSVKELIKNYSKSTGLHEIKIINKELIRQQGYELNSILEKNNSIKVTNIISIVNGGKEKYIDENDIHPSNVAMFKKVNNVINLKFSGIDYISTDLKKPYFIDGKVIEVNPGPGFSIKQQNDKNIIEKWIDAAFN